MKTRSIVKGLVVAAGMACGVSYAAATFQQKGTWPSSWPEELNPLRERASTMVIMAGNREVWYEIPFYSREEFERAWPHIISLKSKGAPIILESSPFTNFLGKVLTSGVRILWPSGIWAPLA